MKPGVESYDNQYPEPIVETLDGKPYRDRPSVLPFDVGMQVEFPTMPGLRGRLWHSAECNNYYTKQPETMWLVHLHQLSADCWVSEHMLRPLQSQPERTP